MSGSITLGGNIIATHSGVEGSGVVTAKNVTLDDNTVQGKGIAKVWVNFNGTLDTAGSSLSVNENVLIRASHNVSSINFIGTGDYDINFTQNLSDSNYAVVGLAGYGNNNNVNNAMRVASISSNGDLSANVTVSKVRIATLYGNGQDENSPYVSIAIFGS